MIAFSKFADCVISVGNIDEEIELPPVQKVIGGETMGVDNLEGPFDGSMKLPIRLFPNAISLAGLTKVTTEEY